MLKKRTPLWREAHLEVNMLKNHMFGPLLDLQLRHTTLQQNNTTTTATATTTTTTTSNFEHTTATSTTTTSTSTKLQLQLPLHYN